MKRQPILAVTLLETLTVLSIVAILVAIMTAAFQRAKEASKLTRSMSNMRQIGLSLSMYRETWSVDSADTTVSGRGFPDSVVQLKLPDAILHTGGQLVNPDHPESDRYTQLWPFWMDGPALTETFLKIMDREGDHTVVLVDDTQNSGTRPKSNFMKRQRALGLLLDTSVISRERVGNPTAQDFWRD